METNRQNSGNNNRLDNATKQKQDQNKFDQSQKNKNGPSKKNVYIKDMPPIEGARPGIL